MLFKAAMVVAGAIGSQAVWNGILFFVLPRDRQRVVWESRLVLAFHLLWIGVGMLYLPGLLYLLLAQAFGHFLLIICLTGEHNGLLHQGSILARTRTTLTLPLVRWLMWNMPYHAEHHAYPAVPWHALPRLHQLLLPELEHIEPGYFSFHRRALRSLLKGQAFEDKTSRLQPNARQSSESA